MFLAERFHHLLDAEDDLGLIVIDSRFREDDHRSAHWEPDQVVARTEEDTLEDSGSCI